MFDYDERFPFRLPRLLRRQLADDARLPRAAGHLDDPGSLGTRLQAGLLARSQRRSREVAATSRSMARFKTCSSTLAQAHLGHYLPLTAVVMQPLLGVGGDCVAVERPKSAARGLPSLLKR